MQVSNSSFNGQVVSNNPVKNTQPSTQTQQVPAQTEQTNLAPQDSTNVDNKLTGKQESKFDPAGFKFQDKEVNKDKEPKYEKVNPLVHLAAAVLSIAGGVSGASYNENLNQSVNNGLRESADFTGRHGLSDDYTMNPFGGMRSEIKQTSKEEEAQRQENQRAKEASDKMVNQKITNQRF